MGDLIIHPGLDAAKSALSVGGTYRRRYDAGRGAGIERVVNSDRLQAQPSVSAEVETRPAERSVRWGWWPLIRHDLRVCCQRRGGGMLGRYGAVIGAPFALCFERLYLGAEGSVLPLKRIKALQNISFTGL